MAKKTYKVISLFTGAGGLDIGFEESNFEILAAIEKIPAFKKTLEVNRDAGRTKRKDMRIYGDIESISPQVLLSELGLKPGEVDLIIGGPPCQSFSNAGRKGTLQDPRGTMLWRFLEYVEAIQPKMFVMENVRGLMSAAMRHRPIAQRPLHGGPELQPDEKPGSVIEAYAADLSKQYRFDIFEVNAANYGAPQTRERVIFIGNRYNHLIEFPAPTYGAVSPDKTSTLFSLESKLKPFRTIRQALEGLDDPNPVVLDFSPRKKKYLAMIPEGSNWRSLPPEIAEESMGRAYFAKGGRSGWWRRLSFDLPSPTLVTLPNHASTSLCHPIETRALSVREYARIQEFPDDWEFCGKVAEQYAQIGNAVPVRLARVCAEVVRGTLDNIYHENFAIRPESHPAYRVVYLQSHVRTRRWFSKGETVVWKDGENNDIAHYSKPVTLRRVQAPGI